MGSDRGPRWERVAISCRECFAKGTLRIDLWNSSFENNTVHLEGCSLHIQKLARHFRRKEWRTQEKKANALVGANATLASGALLMDGDGRLMGEWVIECKGTEKNSYRVPQNIWHKVTKTALSGKGERPLLHVQFNGSNPLRSFVVIPEEWWAEKTSDAPTSLLVAARNELFVEKFGHCFKMSTLDPPAVAVPDYHFKELNLK